MFPLLQSVIQQVEGLQRDLSQLRANHVNSQTSKQAFQTFVDDFFRKIRPTIAIYQELETILSEVDAILQKILTLTHSRSTVASYRKCLTQVKKKLIGIEALSLVCASPSGNKRTSEVDSQIIETLQRLLPSAAAAYEQAISDLYDTRRKSYRGPATDLREALRETLDHLAPDVNVTKQEGYKQEHDTHGPTMKQKVRYILLSRGVSRAFTETPEQATDAIEKVVGTFVRSVYTRSSISTHTPTDRNEVLRVRDWVRVVLCELLEIR
jgi:hypothetical protein